MSQSNEKSILTMTLQPSEELKSLFTDAKADMQQTRAAIELWQRQAERTITQSEIPAFNVAMEACHG